MSHGGKRTGAGRKRIHDEIEARDIAIAAIVEVYGSLQDGMKALLLSQEPSLLKFVYEHALGKPTERVQHSSDPENPVKFILDARFETRDGS
jgi:hypothetical protein